jgi:hypothetical protein
MTTAERKAVGYLIRQASDLYAAGVGNKPVWEGREIMRESIAQYVEEKMPLFDSDGYMAEVLFAANGGQP